MGWNNVQSYLISIALGYFFGIVMTMTAGVFFISVGYILELDTSVDASFEIMNSLRGAAMGALVGWLALVFERHSTTNGRLKFSSLRIFVCAMFGLYFGYHIHTILTIIPSWLMIPMVGGTLVPSFPAANVAWILGVLMAIFVTNRIINSQRVGMSEPHQEKWRKFWNNENKDTDNEA